MKTNLTLIIGTTILLLAGCASGPHRGVVAMKIDDTTAHVGLTRGEVKEGDHVELYGNSCGIHLKGEGRNCTKVNKGHGTVTQILNNDYVTVKFENGVKFAEGDFVEKHSH